MTPKIEQKLSGTLNFKKVCLSAIARFIKTELDRLTVNVDDTKPVNNADVKLLVKLKYWMINDGFQDRTNPEVAAQQYVTSILSMFNDEPEGDDITYTTDNQGALIVDVNATKPVLIKKIKDNAYLYGLAGVVASDFPEPEVPAE